MGDGIRGAVSELRRAEQGDAAAIADVFLAARRAAMPWLPELHGRDATMTFFRDVVPARAEVWVALAPGGALAGFIAFGGGEVEHLYVAPGRQRQGVGAQLLGLAQARGSPLELWAFRRNADALAFYARHGFRVLYETDGAHNEEREPDARLRWDPPASP